MRVFIWIVILTSSVLLVGAAAEASSEEDISYPIAELGDCAAEGECRAYCDDPSHLGACLDFAQLHNLMSEQELARARQVQVIGEGPGGCRGAECEAYCSDVNHLTECLAFAEEHGLMDEADLAEARKVARALEGGAQLPGGCQSKESCEAYCEDSSHMRECLAFAEQAGFLSREELAEAKQALAAIEAGHTPPGNCAGKQECEAYCQDPGNAKECLDFAVAAGFVPPEERQMAEKMMELMAQGRTPGGCTNRQECEAYCSQEGNAEECAEVFASAGLITPEEAELLRKTGGGGPGGCRGREECEAFCNEAAHQQECFAFAEEHGLVPQEDIERLQEGLEKVHSAPPEVAQCLRDRVGSERVDKILEGSFVPGPEIGETMRACFEEFFGQEARPVLPEGIPPEARDCVERLVGGLGGPPGPELEQRIRQECFPEVPEQRPEEFERPPSQEFERAPEQGFEPPKDIREFVPQEFQHLIGEGAESLSPEELERQIREERERELRERFEFHEGGASLINAIRPFLTLLGI